MQTRFLFLKLSVQGLYEEFQKYSKKYFLRVKIHAKIYPRAATLSYLSIGVLYLVTHRTSLTHAYVAYVDA